MSLSSQITEEYWSLANCHMSFALSSKLTPCSKTERYKFENFKFSKMFSVLTHCLLSQRVKFLPLVYKGGIVNVNLRNRNEENHF